MLPIFFIHSHQDIIVCHSLFCGIGQGILGNAWGSIIMANQYENRE